MVQVVQIRGRGSKVEVIWTKSKRTAILFRETVPKYDCLRYGLSGFKVHKLGHVGHAKFNWSRFGKRSFKLNFLILLQRNGCSGIAN